MKEGKKEKERERRVFENEEEREGTKEGGGLGI